MGTLFNIRRKHVEGARGKLNLSSATVILPENSYPYTGNPITPIPTVRYDSTVLTANRDYTVSYDANVNIGEAVVIVTGIGEYSGSKSVNFYVTKPVAGAWNFDLTKTEFVASADKTSISATFRSLSSIPGQNERILASTGSGYFARVLSVPEFTASGVAEESTMTSGSTMLEANTYSVTPDGLKWFAFRREFFNPGNYKIYTATTEHAFAANELVNDVSSWTEQSAIGQGYQTGPFRFTDDGMWLIVMDHSSSMRVYPLSSAYNLATAGEPEIWSAPVGVFDFAISPNGLSLVIQTYSGWTPVFVKYALQSKAVLSGAVEESRFTTDYSTGGYFHSFVINPAGTKMLTAFSNGSATTIREYGLEE